MVSAPFLVALLALFWSLAALEFYSSLDIDKLVGATTWVQAVQALLPVAAMWALLAAVASIYRELSRAAAAGTEAAVGVICAAVGVIIQFFSFVHQGAQVDDGACAREIGTAAAHLLPAAATTTFFLSLALVFLHVRAGGGALAGEGPVQILVKIVLGATAVLAGLMALAL